MNEPIYRKKQLALQKADIIAKALGMAEEWQQDYNCSRPHQALGFVPPLEYI